MSFTKGPSASKKLQNSGPLAEPGEKCPAPISCAHGRLRRDLFRETHPAHGHHRDHGARQEKSCADVQRAMVADHKLRGVAGSIGETFTLVATSAPMIAMPSEP